MSEPEAIVRDYFARLKRALAPLPGSRRNQLLDDLREHVTMARADVADESETSVREILDHLGTPEEIAAEALAGTGRWDGWTRGPRWLARGWRSRPRSAKSFQGARWAAPLRPGLRREGGQR